MKDFIFGVILTFSYIHTAPIVVVKIHIFISFYIKFIRPNMIATKH